MFKYAGILVIFCLALGFSAFSQSAVNGSVKGKLQDTVYKESLADATVSVLRVKDSVEVAHTVAKADGSFEIKNLPAGLYRLLVSYQGYSSYAKNFMISESFPNVDMKEIAMEKKATTLDEVVVEGPPIQVKGDTTEFRASAFAVKPNATAEDILKKLPGVQVDKDGNVQAQGESVQKVYVDGKEFFGTDPKLATKNITADMIESIQVFDDMSDQAKFTRIDDGSRQKTLNIKLKKNMRKGYFGRITGGIGTDGRYESSLLFNKFNGDQRISILASSNNLNKSAFSFQDIVSTMGGFGSRSGGGMGGGSGYGGGGRGSSMFSMLGGSSNGNGITRSTSAGLNYTDKWGSKIDVTGSYFFSNQNSHNESSSVRQTFFPNDSSTIQNSESRSWNMNQNHRFNLRMEYYIDSNNSILYAPNFVVQHSETESYDTNYTYSNIPGKQYLSITGATSNTNVRDGFNLNNYLLFRHRFKKYGRTFTLGFNNSNNKSNGDGSNVSPLTFYNPDGSVSRVKNQDLENTQDTKSFNNVLSASYTEPIGKNKLLEVNYAYTNNHSTSDRRAYDFNSGTGKYDEINKLQTNYFENDFIAHRAGLNFQVHETKFNYQIGLAMQQSELNSRSVRASTAKDTTLSQSFVNFFPTANFQYQWSRSKNLRIRYRGRTNQPSINQLQDVPDVSNPLQIVTGNPDLKQEFENSLNLNYHTFNMESFKFFNININVSNTNNKIVNSIDSVAKGSGLDSIGKGIILIRPVNLNGAMNASSYVTLGLPLRGKLEGSNFNFNNRISYNRDVSLLYKQRNVTNSFSVTQTAGINLNLKDKYNFGINASLTYNNVTYSVKSSGNLDQEYYTQSYSADINYLGLKDWVFGTDFDYIRNTGLGEGYNQSIPLWNASIAREVLKARNGEIKFSVNDILNQNKSISRSVGNNYIQDTRALVIKRYFMLTLTYNLRKGSAPENGGRREMPPGVNRRYFRMRG